MVFLWDDSGIHDENSFVALVLLNFWHGQPHLQMGFGAFVSVISKALMVVFCRFHVKISSSFVTFAFWCRAMVF